MNDIADKIWAAIQRPSPPVTKDEIVALVNEGFAPRYEHIPHYAGQQLVPVPYGKSPAELGKLLADTMVDLHLAVYGIDMGSASDTIVEKVWFDGEAVQRLPIEPAEYQRDFGVAPAQLKLGDIPVTVDERISGDEWYLVTAKS